MRRKIHYVNPGRVLEMEFMEPYRLSQYRLAKLLDVPETRINRLVRGITGVTPDIAQRLASLFGTTPELWMNLQAHYDLAHARLPPKKLAAIARRQGALRAA